MINPDELQQLTVVLRRRIMDTPMFLKLLIAPLPGYVKGTVPLEGLIARMIPAQKNWEHCRDGIRMALLDSYQPEGDLMYGVIHAVNAWTAAGSPDEAELRETILTLLQQYLSKPELKRNFYVL